jgi:hypothetical protein
VKYTAEKNPDTEHIINIIDDHSSDETLEFINKIATHFNQIPNILITVTNLTSNGIMTSIRGCYEWLEGNSAPDGLVYQVQDDYLFEETAIFEMVSMVFQICIDTNSHPIIMSYNDPYFWLANYRYKSTPRTIVPGVNRYWIQMYDVPCSFLTSTQQFLANYDLCIKLTNFDSTYPNMEVETVNTMFTQRGVLGLAPITSVALHMQGELFMDPYIDWKERWDSVPEVV